MFSTTVKIECDLCFAVEHSHVLLKTDEKGFPVWAPAYKEELVPKGWSVYDSHTLLCGTCRKAWLERL